MNTKANVNIIAFCRDSRWPFIKEKLAKLIENPASESKCKLLSLLQTFTYGDETIAVLSIYRISALIGHK